MQGEKVVLMGFSRGAEQALLIAALLSKSEEGRRDPGLPDVIIAHAPPDLTTPGFSKDNAEKILSGVAFDDLQFTQASWRYQNHRIESYTPIEIEHYQGALLASNGKRSGLGKGFIPKN